MSALAARNVEDPRAGGKAKNIEQASDLSTVACEVEDRTVFEQVVGVEVSGPPVIGNRESGIGNRWVPRPFRFPIPHSRFPS